MKIRSKIAITTIIFSVIAIGVTVLLAIYSIRTEGESKKSEIRKERMEEVENKLRNLVDIAYETIHNNYRNSRDKNFLEKYYGMRLKNCIDIAYELVLVNYQNSRDKDYIEKQYGGDLKSTVDIAFSIIRENARLVKEKKLSLADAKKQAMKTIAAIRFDDAGAADGYLWINDTGEPYPKLLMHPIKPKLNGTSMKAPVFNCARGTNQNLGQAIVKLCKRHGQGFISYLWPKPGNGGKVPKLSYVKLYKPWGWIVGGGVYIEDTVQQAQKKSIRSLGKMRYDHGEGYFWVTNDKYPYPLLLLNPVVTEYEGKILNDAKFNCAIPDGNNLFQVAIDVCRKHGAGFIRYLWPKPSCKSKVPKLTYVKYFKPWNWIIGTGVYIDNAEKEAKALSIDEIRKMRYDFGEGYFWINDTGRPYPKMLLHPFMPTLEGKVMDNPAYNNRVDKTRNLFDAILETCEKQKCGFIRYNWPKPVPGGEAIPNAPKLSYVKIFKPWNWIIGTGIYIDEIDKALALEDEKIEAQINSLILRMLICAGVILILAVIASILLADSLANPINNLIGAMREVRSKGLASVTVSLHGSQEIRTLGRIFNEMLEAINDAVEKLKRTTAAKEKIESELRIARDIQLGIIPKLFPAFPHRPEFDVFAILISAREVGGDLYNFFFIDDDHLFVAIGDVSGKGVPASLFMAVTQTLSRARAGKNLSTGEIITKINNDLCRDNEMSMFVTYFGFILNLKTGNLTFTNAGHNPPYLLAPGTPPQAMTEKHGMPLGVLPENNYGTGKITLKPGQTIFLYTDGVNEAMNPQKEEFGTERLEPLLTAAMGESPEQIINLVLEKVKEFAADEEQSDDITIMALTYRGPDFKLPEDEK